MPPATEYKYSVALSRYASAEAARYRYVGHEFVHPFGGESVTTIWPVEGSGQFCRHAECSKVTNAIIEAKGR